MAFGTVMAAITQGIPKSLISAISGIVTASSGSGIQAFIMIAGLSGTVCMLFERSYAADSACFNHFISSFDRKTSPLSIGIFYLWISYSDY